MREGLGSRKRVGGGQGREATHPCYGGFFDGEPRPTTGRYPANLALECTCESVEVVDAPGHASDYDWQESGNENPKHVTRNIKSGIHYGPCKAIRHTDPNCPAFLLDAQAGESFGRPATATMRGEICGSGHPGMFVGSIATTGYEDSGGPSRFFYCAKASRGEREAGLEGFAIRNSSESSSMPTNQRCATCNGIKTTADLSKRCYCEYPNYQNTGARNHHPTVKPIDLNRWLAALLLPPASVAPRRILVPFAGSGSEMIGALLAGWDEITGIEREADYSRIADARLAHWAAQSGAPEVLGESEIAGTTEKHSIKPAQPSLF